jgi:hypothetical protein
MTLEEQVSALLATGEESDIALAEELLASPFLQFMPRADRPELGDEMESYLTDKHPGKILCGGTGSAKTYTTAWYFASQLFDNPPPEPNTPCWIIAKTLDQSGLIWTQALSKFITPDMIQDNGIRWNKSNLYPDIVQLKKDERGNNYNLHFYSSDMKRQALQAATCWMVWVDEQCPPDIIEECWGRLRKWHHPGQFIFTCTPLDPDEWLENLWNRRDEPEIKALYGFFRLNTACNPMLDPIWVRDWLASLSPDQRATRQFGDFANFRGAIFPEFTSDLIIEPFDTDRFEQFIGVDFGFRHPAALWIARDRDTYYVTREMQLHDTMPEDLAAGIKQSYDYRHKVYVDYADPISTRKLQQAGIHTEPCAGKNVMDSVFMMKNLFHQKRIKVFKNCLQFIRQLRSYRRKDFSEDDAKPKIAPDPAKSTVPLEIIKVRDHLVDAARYAIFTSAKRIVMPWKQPPGKRITLVGEAGMPSILRPRTRPAGFFNQPPFRRQ